MIPEFRQKFNASFTAEKYEEFKDALKSMYGYRPTFREAETPFFIPDILMERLVEACGLISDVVARPDIKEITQGALYSPSVIVKGEDDHTTFLQVDFGICLDEKGDPIPQLIEVHGFPSVYFFQYMVSDLYHRVFDIPESLTSFFNGYDKHSYKKLLYDIIVGDADPKNVVLLEIEPEKQNTYIDLLSTSVELGIPTLCVTRFIKEATPSCSASSHCLASPSRLDASVVTYSLRISPSNIAITPSRARALDLCSTQNFGAPCCVLVDNSRPGAPESHLGRAARADASTARLAEEM